MAIPPVNPFEWPTGRNAALSVTFDDARLSQLDAGMPILNAHGVRGTFFVGVGNLEARCDDWCNAMGQGHELANHTMTHPCSGNFGFAQGNALENLTLERMEDDLLEANEAIEHLTGRRPCTFAYPCGQTYIGRGEDCRSYVPLVAKHFVAGRDAFNEVHNAPGFCDLAQLFSLDADYKELDVLTGWIDAAVASGGWLILMVHDVGGMARQTLRAEVLDALCDRIAGRSEIWVDTMGAVAEYVAKSRTD